MIPHFNITQGRDEWHKIRYGKIGGSRSKGLFVKSDTLFFDVLSELTEPYETDFDEYISDDMLRGMELEPQGRIELSEYTNLPFVECGWLQCEEIPLLGISPDGITTNLLYSCEIKCPEAKRHIQTCYENKTPLGNLHQCLHYFTVNPNLKEHYFCSYRPESIKKIFVEKFDLFTEINLGTKAKPVIKTIAEWRQTAKIEAVLLQNQLFDAIKKLQF